ncbi:MAG: hypothetical protein E3K40_01410 [Candidatus Brocadia sp.]|nr:hypothetical protein [Candidatus Brocadia sp.]
MFVSNRLSTTRGGMKVKTGCTDAIEYQELSGRKVMSEFNGGYCYLPLYIFCDGYLLCAKLRTSGVDASEGAKEETERIVNHIRSRWPDRRHITMKVIP